MSRSRKQRERKLKAKMHEANNKMAAMRHQLSAQNNALADYIGGVTKFGHLVLQSIAATSSTIDPLGDHRSLGTYVMARARDMGFIAPIATKPGQKYAGYELTHLCKEVLGGATKAPGDGH